MAHIEVLRGTARRFFRGRTGIKLDLACGGALRLGDRILNRQEITDLAFGLDGGEIEVACVTLDGADFGRTGQIGAYLTIARHPAYDTAATRYIYLDAASGVPTPRIMNFKVVVSPDSRNRGIGEIALARQIRRARELGFGGIDALVAGSPEHPSLHGYAYLPTKGFQGLVPDEVWAELPRDGLERLGLLQSAGPVDVRDIIECAGGKEFWQQHGQGFPMSFDLSNANTYVTRAIRLLKELEL